MLTPGPSTTSTPSAIASCAMARPICRSTSGSQVEALQDAVGKQVAGLAEIAIEPSSATRRTPCGPSETVSAGRPRRSTAVVVQAVAPVQSAAFSSRVILSTRDLASVTLHLLHPVRSDPAPLGPAVISGPTAEFGETRGGPARRRPTAAEVPGSAYG